jgi:hypothetical protein
VKLAPNKSPKPALESSEALAALSVAARLGSNVRPKKMIPWIN